jgi:hypothetical protein
MDRQLAYEQERNRAWQGKEFDGDLAGFGGLASGVAGVLDVAGRSGLWLFWVLGIWALALISHGI